MVPANHEWQTRIARSTYGKNKEEVNLVQILILCTYLCCDFIEKSKNELL